MSVHALSAARSWAVLTEKSDGRQVCFGVYPERADALRVVEELARIGCPSHVERARATDVAGRERRT